jgi:hypothetical protein
MLLERETALREVLRDEQCDVHWRQQRSGTTDVILVGKHVLARFAACGAHSKSSSDSSIRKDLLRAMTADATSATTPPDESVITDRSERRRPFPPCRQTSSAAVPETERLRDGDRLVSRRAR